MSQGSHSRASFAAGCVTACPSGGQCWGCSSSPLLSSWPVLSPGSRVWARGTSSGAAWLACPPCCHLSGCPGFQRQSEALLPMIFLARSWVLLSMWIQSLFIFKGVQKHEPPGSWYLWLLFRCSSTSLHLCSPSCPQKLKVFLIDVHREWSCSWTSVPDSLDENHLKQIPQNNPYLCLCWGVDIVKVRCTSVSLLFHKSVLVSALRRYVRWRCCFHPSWW